MNNVKRRLRLLKITDDDVFISYARIDTTTYAIGLANALTEKGFSCFTDRLGTDANENLPPMLLEKIRKSRMFILLCSSGAIRSEFVRQELTEFITSKGTAKMVVPVIFDDAAKKQEWYKQIIGIASEFESIDLLNTGNPSESVINRIEKSFRYSKSKERLRNYTIGASITLLALLTASVVATIYASNQLETAETAKSEADKQRRVATEQTKLAIDAKTEALIQTDSATKAKEKANTAIALQKTAETNTKKAIAQLKDVNIQVNERQYELDVTNTFGVFRQGAEKLKFSSVDKVERQFTYVVKRLKSLKLDPLIGLHGRLAADLINLKAKPIITVQPAVSFIKLSEKESQLLVVYGERSFGSVDVEDNPEKTSFEVFDLKSGKLISSKPIGDSIGKFLFGLQEPSVLGFEESGYIILNSSYNDSIPTLEKYSLKDGSLKELNASEVSKYTQKGTIEVQKTSRTLQFIDAELSPQWLYKVHPDDGISTDYSRRLVDKVVKESPNSRTMFVGTYEGKNILLDLAAQHKRGEIMTTPVFAADYTFDSNYIFVANELNICKIDARGCPELDEISVPLELHKNAWDNERILELAISDDGQLVALASQYRLIVYQKPNKSWTDWKFPDKLDSVAGMDIDTNNQKVSLVTDQGSIFTADCVSKKLTSRESPLSTLGPVIAWMEPGGSMAWIAPKSMASSPIEVYKIPIYGESSAIEKLTIQFPDLGLDSNDNIKPEIHALARVENQLAFIFGDSESLQDNHPLMSEQLMVTTIGSPQPGKIKKLYESNHVVDDLGEPHWNISPAHKIASVSNEMRMMAQTNLEGMMSLGLDGSIRRIKSNLGSRDIILDKDGGYNIALDFTENFNIKLNITHLRRDVKFDYTLPWKFNNEPCLAAICPNGRKVVVVSKEGDILIVDISDDIHR
jgi:hypothetical protein